MKTVFNNKQLAHVWASNSQVEGSNPGQSFYFNAEGIFSYGSHFMIAKRINPSTVVMTTRSYGNATAKQMSYVRNAVSHLKVVYCEHPENSVLQNKSAALCSMDTRLKELHRKGIRDTTKVKIKAEAQSIAVTFNEYLAAVGDPDVQPIPVDADLEEQLKAMYLEQEQVAIRKAREDGKAAVIRLEAWKRGENPAQRGFGDLPVALRVKDMSVIQTSHGAEIPLSAAPRLWKLVCGVKKEGADFSYTNIRLGHYPLNTIKSNGDIVVGCHNISYEELQRMALELGYIKEGETA